VVRTEYRGRVGPVTGGAELGEFGVDIDLDGAEEADVLAVRRRNVCQHLIVDAPA
jgi:hypothetical protein